MNYQPVGSKVLLKILPIVESSVAIPDHLQNASAMKKTQFFKIEGLGRAASDENFPLTIGQVIQISAHPKLLVGIDHEQQLCVCDKTDIAVICTEDEMALGQN